MTDNKNTNSNAENSSAGHKHIKNTDNESTRMLPNNSDNFNTAEFKALINQAEQGSKNVRSSVTNRQPSSAQPHSQPVRRQTASDPQAPLQRTPKTSANNQFRSNGMNQGINHSQQNRPYPNRPANHPQNGNNGYYGNNGQNNYPNGNNGYYNNNGQNNYPNGSNGYYNNNGQNNYPNGNNGYYNNNGQNNYRNPGYGQPVNPAANNMPEEEYYDYEEPKRSSVPKNTHTKKSKKKKSRTAKILTRIIIILLILFLVIFGIYSCTAITLIRKMNHVETGSRNHVAGALSAEHVTSVLIIGTDGRDTNDSGRSDSIILVSLNSKTDKITLTSFMRDSYVEIPGYGNDKLNHSYAYGGAELLMDTIELNFNVRIDDYVKVNFGSFTSILDAVGGIDVEISEEEAQEINTILMAEVNELMGDPADSDLLGGGGMVHLNGKQALAYSRIRYVGNADFERTERQRLVISKAVEKLKSFSPSVISSIASDAIPQLSTNMDTSSLYLLSLKLPFLLGDEMQQIQIPADNTYWSTTTSSGGDALGFDFDANYAILRDQVYGR